MTVHSLIEACAERGVSGALTCKMALFLLSLESTRQEVCGWSAVAPMCLDSAWIVLISPVALFWNLAWKQIAGGDIIIALNFFSSLFCHQGASCISCEGGGENCRELCVSSNC